MTNAENEPDVGAARRNVHGLRSAAVRLGDHLHDREPEPRTYLVKPFAFAELARPAQLCATPHKPPRRR